MRTFTFSKKWRSFAKRNWLQTPRKKQPCLTSWASWWRRQWQRAGRIYQYEQRKKRRESPPKIWIWTAAALAITLGGSASRRPITPVWRVCSRTSTRACQRLQIASGRQVLCTTTMSEPRPPPLTKTKRGNLLPTPSVLTTKKTINTKGTIACLILDLL